MPLPFACISVIIFQALPLFLPSIGKFLCTTFKMKTIKKFQLIPIKPLLQAPKSLNSWTY